MSTASATPIVIGSAIEVVPAIPHLLGFRPSNSLVVLGLAEGQRVLFTARWDADAPADQMVASVHEAAGRNGVTGFVLVGWGTTTAAVRDTLDAFAALGAQVEAVALCDNDGHHASCMTADGNQTPWGTLPVTASQAQFVAKGSAPLASRAEVAAVLAPRPAPAGFTAALADRLPCAPGVARTTGVRAWAALLKAGGIGGVPAEVLADAAAALTDIGVRDLLLTVLGPFLSPDPDQAEKDEVARLTGLLPTVEPGQARQVLAELVSILTGSPQAQAAALLATIAWIHGQGVIAGDAAVLALTADPGCHLAELILTCIEHGVRLTGC